MQTVKFLTKKYYISSIYGMSGISKYSRDFYQLVLKDKGYIYMDSRENLTTILSAISSKDHVHIELGIFQKKEIEILFTMLRANYKNVAVTLHDAPLIKYPYYEFKNSFLNKVSKAFDILGNSFGAVLPYVKKIKSIYVLSKRGLEAVKRRYKVDNVFYLPHVVDFPEMRKRVEGNNNFIYFGFIGRNKGIEYALQLHQQVIHSRPDIHFYIVGKPLGKESHYYDTLREKYTKNVHYLGYVPDEALQDIFDQATFALQLFRNYRFFWPFSGSILYSLKKGKILLTNNVNTVPEIIENGKNGFFLSGKIREDLKMVNNIINDKALLDTMQQEAYNYLLTHHSAEAVKEKFKD
jgi:glycosyltransferase involved in cell wall biosynthesis